MWLFWLILALMAMVAFAFVSRWLLDTPREEPVSGMFFRFTEWYARLVHSLRVEGRNHIPAGRHPGALIVISNHTAGIDPLLIQAACPFEIRWMMAQDMRLPAFEWFWNYAGIISVKRTGRDVRGTRDAIRHLRHGGVIGVFPEGGLERPPRQIRRFHAGVGLLIAKTKVRVLPVIVDGTPAVDHAWASLIRPSRSRVVFHEPIDYADSGLTPDEIALDLRQRYLAWTGWKANDMGNLPGETDAPTPTPG